MTYLKRGPLLTVKSSPPRKYYLVWECVRENYIQARHLVLYPLNVTTDSDTYKGIVPRQFEISECKMSQDFSGITDTRLYSQYIQYEFHTTDAPVAELEAASVPRIQLHSVSKETDSVISRVLPFCTFLSSKRSYPVIEGSESVCPIP